MPLEIGFLLMIIKSDGKCQSEETVKIIMKGLPCQIYGTINSS